MPVPLALAAPAAAAALAYLSARFQIGYDVNILRAMVSFKLLVRRLERSDRCNLFYPFEERALSPRDGDRIWLIYHGKTWTFKEGYTIVLKYARYLKEQHGIGSRETVALDFTNKPEFLFLILAVWSFGAVPALINTSVTGNGLAHSLRTAGARLAIVDADLAQAFSADVIDEMRSGDERFQHVILEQGLVESILTQPKGLREPDGARSGVGINSGFKTAFLVFTSGTTGLPKAAVVSHFKAWASTCYVQHWAGLRRNDVYYTCMPVYHLTACGMCFIPSLTIGYTVALGARFSIRTFWPEVRAAHATVIQYVGETCRYLLAAPPQRDPATGADWDRAHRVRLAYGNGLRPDVWERFRARFGVDAVAEFYAATEAPTATWNLARNALNAGAVGRTGALLRLLFGGRHALVEIDWAAAAPRRVPAPDGRHAFCRRVAPGAVGELLLRLQPDQVAVTFQGYHGNAAASAAKVLRDVFAPGDAWYRTGDALRRDAAGRLFFADRLGDTFRWRAENVATTEVAEALGAHPRIAEANVYGVALPHHDGRAGCAALRLSPEGGGDGGGEADAEDAAEALAAPSPELLRSVAALAAARLPNYAVPLFVRVVRRMGTTGTNKQQKHVLQACGVDPAQVGPDERLYWLRDGTYVPFGQRDWEELNGGRVRL